jgi:hypothetical protein
MKVRDIFHLEWWPIASAWAWIADRDGKALLPFFGLSANLAQLTDRRDLKQAQAVLLAGLRSGSVRARGSRLSGYPVETALDQEIAPGEWATAPSYELFSDEVLLVEFPIAGFGYAGVRINVTDLRRIAPPRAKSSGRPRQYPWDAFMTQAVAVLDQEGLPGPDPEWNQARFERRMAAWCLENWGKEPAASAIREHTKKAIEQFVAQRQQL